MISECEAYLGTCKLVVGDYICAAIDIHSPNPYQQAVRQFLDGILVVSGEQGYG